MDAEREHLHADDALVAIIVIISGVSLGHQRMSWRRDEKTLISKLI